MQKKIITVSFPGGLAPPFTGMDVGMGRTETGGVLVSLQQVRRVRGTSCAGVRFCFETGKNQSLNRSIDTMEPDDSRILREQLLEPDAT